MADVALYWVASRPGVSSVLIGASRSEQLLQNLASLDFTLSEAHQARLDDATQLPLINPYFIFKLPSQVLFGGQTVRGWRRA